MLRFEQKVLNRRVYPAIRLHRGVGSPEVFCWGLFGFGEGVVGGGRRFEVGVDHCDCRVAIAAEICCSGTVAELDVCGAGFAEGFEIALFVESLCEGISLDIIRFHGVGARGIIVGGETHGIADGGDVCSGNRAGKFGCNFGFLSCGFGCRFSFFLTSCCGNRHCGSGEK